MVRIAVLSALVLFASAVYPDEAVWNHHIQEGGSAYKRQDYKAAASHFELALREARSFHAEDTRVAGTLNSLADTYRQQSRYQEAEAAYKESLGILEKSLGLEAPIIAVVSIGLGQLYRAQLRLAEAEPPYRRALAIMEKVHGPDHSSVAAILTTHLADLYIAAGRLKEVEPLYKRSLAIVEKNFGPEHPSTGIALRNLADLHMRFFQLSEAQPLYERTLAIFEKTLGPTHPQVATALANLASVYHSQGRHEEAANFSKRAVAIAVSNKKRASVGSVTARQEPRNPETAIDMPRPPSGLPIPYKGATFKPGSEEQQQYFRYLDSTPMFPDRLFCEKVLSERLRTAAQPGSPTWKWVTDPFLSWDGKLGTGAIIGPIEYLSAIIEAHVDFRDVVHGREQHWTFSCVAKYATFDNKATWQAGHLRYGWFINAGHHKFATGRTDMHVTSLPGTASSWHKEILYYQGK